MKTKNLFLATIVTLFGVILESSGQNNLWVNANDNQRGLYNVLLGGQVGNNIPLGDTTTNANVFIGHQAAYSTTVNSINNVFVGYNSGKDNTDGSFNTFLGYGAGRWNTTADENTYVGYSCGGTGEQNSSYGFLSGSGSSGSFNTFLGFKCGYQCTGSNNVFIGYQSGLSSNLSNKLIVKDNSLFQPLIFGEFDNRKLLFNVDTGGTQFASYVEINGNNNASGLRFTNLNNGNTAPDNTTNKVLSVNSTGDVILVKDIGGGITSACNKNYFIPVSNASGNLSCSQIFDNGTGVGVGYTAVPTDPTFFNYNYVNGSITYTNYTGGSAPTNYSTGPIKLHVNGNARANGIWTTSDKRFKKDIKPIENALTIVQSLEGKTYLWDREANRDMNFDGGDHSGFIAQDLEKVLPHLVITSQEGDKAVNYTELLPYLVEAIKEQQTQINDLKAQLSENFKAQNQDLIELNNTKIISVSPNPSNDVITVSFNVEKSVQSAKLQVHDLNGIVISSLNINDRDNNITRTLQKDNFGKGIYIVTLVVNGKSIDTKKIVFN